MLLIEIFNKKLEWELEQKSSSVYRYKFITPKKQEVIVEIMSVRKSSIDEWEIVFYVTDERGMLTAKITNAGKSEQFLIFSTVIDIVNNFINERHPEGIAFTAKEPSRISLYKKMISLNSFKNYIYTSQENTSEGERFHLIRRDLQQSE